MSLGQRVPHVLSQDFFKKPGIFALSHHRSIGHVLMQSVAQLKVVYGLSQIALHVASSHLKNAYFVHNSVKKVRISNQEP